MLHFSLSLLIQPNINYWSWNSISTSSVTYSTIAASSILGNGLSRLREFYKISL